MPEPGQFNLPRGHRVPGTPLAPTPAPSRFFRDGGMTAGFGGVAPLTSTAPNAPSVPNAISPIAAQMNANGWMGNPSGAGVGQGWTGGGLGPAIHLPGRPGFGGVVPPGGR